MPGDEQQHRQRDEVLPVDLAALQPLGDEFVEDALARFLALAVDERAEVGVEPVAGVLDVGRGGAAQQSAGLLLEELVIGVGDAEQGADHGRGQWQRVGAHQVDGGSGRRHAVEQPVDGLLDARAQRGGPFEGEVREQHAALGAVFGVVHAEEREAAPAADGRDARVEHREVGPGAVGGEPGVGEQGPRGGVAGDQPDGAAVVEGDAGQRPLLAQGA